MASLNSAFLVAYGLMYLGAGKLMDVVGTRLGFALIMVFWSLACASHGLANGVMMLVISRLLLGIGEGGASLLPRERWRNGSRWADVQLPWES